MITSPKYSFIQFNPDDPDSCCNGINTVCLPVVNNNDLQFQVINDSAPGSLLVVRMNGDTVSTQSGFISEGNNVYSWKSAIDLTGLACNECFQLKIGTVLSNCFIKKCDDCFTTLLEYVNDEDYAGFAYCNVDFKNKVRLPFYLSKPKMTEDRGVYRKSNGVIRLTKSLLTKEYQAQTDYMTEAMHDALCVALAHDTINVYSSTYSGAISKSSEYNIPWDDDMCIAQADFKVSVTPFAIKNNNCQDCAEPVVCVPVAISGSPDLPGAVVGTAYNYSFALSGDGPFDISSIVKPAWLLIGLSGNNVIFSGTPGNNDVIAAAGLATINIISGGGSYTNGTYTDVPVTTGSGSGHDATANVTVSGGAISAITIVKKGDDYAVGDTLFILNGSIGGTGTGSSLEVGSVSDNTGAGNISFTISNCAGANHVDFADIIDITEADACNPVAIVGTPALPDAVVGTAYSYSFSLTGTAPFTLSSVVKPSWMTIAVSGSNIIFSGTPDAEGEDIAVSFTINNCDADTVDFSDTINSSMQSIFITGLITHGVRSIQVSLAETVPFDVTLSIEGSFDNEDTPTAFVAEVTVLANASSGTTYNVVPGTIICLDPTNPGGDELLYATTQSPYAYFFTLTIDDPC